MKVKAEDTNDDFIHKDFNFESDNKPVEIKFEFDYINISDGLTIFGNQVKALNNTKIIHKFVLGKAVLNKTEKEWKVKINKYVKFLGLGICIKETVVKNELKFFNFSDPKFRHGCYLVSLNGFSWNTTDESQNNKEIKDFPKVNENEVIAIKYSNMSNELSFNFENSGFKYKMGKLEAKSEVVPCAVLLHNNDEIVFEW